MKVEMDLINESSFKLVDLDLPSGTLWMDRNVGASSPTDGGLYFAWGETQGYTDDEVGETKQFSWDDYKYVSSVYNKLTKYCNDEIYGNAHYMDNWVSLDITDDAAYQYTNGKCKVPTKAQLQELLDNTTSTWTTQNGVNGRLFTSKTNGNSIFVPANGYCYDDMIFNVGYSGSLWSSSLYEGNANYAWYLGFGSGGVGIYDNDRCDGLSVRGVVNKL